MKIYIVVMDIINDVTHSRKSVNTHVVITLLLHGVTHWKTAMSNDKKKYSSGGSLSYYSLSFEFYY